MDLAGELGHGRVLSRLDVLLVVRELHPADVAMSVVGLGHWDLHLLARRV